MNPSFSHDFFADYNFEETVEIVGKLINVEELSVDELKEFIIDNVGKNLDDYLDVITDYWDLEDYADGGSSNQSTDKLKLIEILLTILKEFSHVDNLKIHIGR